MNTITGRAWSLLLAVTFPCVVSCTPPVRPYLLPAGFERAFSGPATNLVAVSFRIDRIELFYTSGGQVRHRWLEISSDESEAWSPEEPLGTGEAPAAVVWHDKIVLVATTADASGINQARFRVFDPAAGWGDWIAVPGNAPYRISVAATDTDIELYGVDQLRPLTAAITPSTPQWGASEWSLMPLPRSNAQFYWITTVSRPGWNPIVYGRLNTGEFFFAFGPRGSWTPVDPLRGDIPSGATAYYYGGFGPPVFFSSVPAAPGSSTLRFLWTDSDGGQHPVDFGPRLNPPIFVPSELTGNPDTERLHLFQTMLTDQDAFTGVVRASDVLLSDVQTSTLTWTTLGGNLSFNMENLTAISSEPERLDVFVTDNFGNIWHKWRDTRTTLGWQPPFP